MFFGQGMQGPMRIQAGKQTKNTFITCNLLNNSFEVYIYIYIKLASKTNSLNTNTVPTPITHHQIIDFEQVLCTLSCCSWNPSCANELLAMWTRETWTCAVAPEDLNSACHGKDIKLWLVGQLFENEGFRKS